MIKGIMAAFQNGAIAFKGRKIDILRADFDSMEAAFDEAGMRSRKDKAFFLLRHKGRWYKYEEYINAEILTHWINRVLYPVALLKTKEDVEKFADTEAMWPENTPFFPKGNIDIPKFTLYLVPRELH